MLIYHNMNSLKYCMNIFYNCTLMYCFSDTFTYQIIINRDGTFVLDKLRNYPKCYPKCYPKWYPKVPTCTQKSAFPGPSIGCVWVPLGRLGYDFGYHFRQNLGYARVGHFGFPHTNGPYKNKVYRISEYPKRFSAFSVPKRVPKVNQLEICPRDPVGENIIIISTDWQPSPKLSTKIILGLGTTLGTF